MSIPSIRKLLDMAWGFGASDLYLVPGYSPAIRKGGEIQRDFVPGSGSFAREPLDGEGTLAFAREVATDEQLEGVRRTGYLDIGVPLSDGVLARVGIASTRGELSIVARILKQAIPRLEEANVPEVVKELMLKPNGIVLVSGPHGSGKTTTMYMMIDWLNENHARHICTVEDPIYISLTPKKSIIQQREVGVDVPDTASGVTAAMHQDLDVIMLGEITDLEALAAAIRAAETGHLVLVQIHAVSTADAVQRLISALPEDMEGFVRRQLADVLRGVVHQRLVPRKSGKGRIAVCDVLLVDDAYATAISKGGDLAALKGGEGSVSIRDEVDKLLSAGEIDEAERIRFEL